MLEESLTMNPSNVEAILNLARLYSRLEYNQEDISTLYEIAMKNLPDKRLKREIKREHKSILSDLGKEKELGPIQLRR